MSVGNLEQASVHYASEALWEVRRALERELAAETTVNNDVSQKLKQRPQQRNEDCATSAHQSHPLETDFTAASGVSLVAAPQQCDATHDSLSGKEEVTGCMHSTADDETSRPVVTAADTSGADPVLVQQEETADEMEYVSRHPKFKEQFDAVLEQIRKQRKRRESIATLEGVDRDAVADLWALQWEDLYELFLVHRQRAAEDMRERYSQEHWRERVDARRRELAASLEYRPEEAVLHTRRILEELDFANYRAWRNEQLASFHAL